MTLRALLAGVAILLPSSASFPVPPVAFSTSVFTLSGRRTTLEQRIRIS
jgi:hypothetical protein